MNRTQVKMMATNLDLRTEMFEGKKHLVAPVILLTEGVHNGLFYPATELEKFPMSWNGRPVPIYHPEKNGEPICCNDPEILQTQSVGTLFNVFFDDSSRKLKGEVWIDENKAREVSPEALSLIRKGGKLEVSTGLYVEADGQPGIWNSEEYEQTVINYRPDHLALLPGTKGACSWEDGCGVRANQREDDNKTADKAPVENGEKEEKDTDEAKLFAAQLMEKEYQPSFFRRLASYLGLISLEMSHQDIHRYLQEWANTKDKGGGTDNFEYNYVSDVFEDHFIFRRETPTGVKTYKASYSATKTGVEVNETEPIIEVKELIDRKYVPVENNDFKEVKTMNKEKFVQALIDNSKSQFTADDKEWLMAQEESLLKKIEGTCCPPEDPKPNTEVKVLVEDKETPKPATPATLEEFVASAPKEVADVIINAMNESKKRKERLVEYVVANSEIPKERVEKKEIDDLEMLAETISKLAKKPAPDFSLNAGVFPNENVVTGAPDIEPLVAPVINWKE